MAWAIWVNATKMVIFSNKGLSLTQKHTPVVIYFAFDEIKQIRTQLDGLKRGLGNQFKRSSTEHDRPNMKSI
ncbi:hypothetical protein AALO_G00036190 [Alosa alosa]|uniref:Uncharacterized protein n=1 Tax=Alosa alosa TaxID=278164 RepID=A0AAV6HAS9_9TELE|nr:hypothetical protein AALO_G00036190 [Alosa alosa]